MKKKLFVFAVAVLIGSGSINAQSFKERLSMGIKAEANCSNFILSDMPGIKSSMGFGGGAGLSTKFKISKNFAIQDDCMFTYSTSELKQGAIKDTYQYFGMVTSIYPIGQWEIYGKGRIYGGIGPYFTTGFRAKMKDSGQNLYKKTYGVRMKRMTAGITALLGYEFASGFQVNANYKFGITNDLDAEMIDAKMRAQSVSIGIGYHF